MPVELAAQKLVKAEDQGFREMAHIATTLNFHR